MHNPEVIAAIDCMVIPEHMRQHIKKLYIIFSRELSNIKEFINKKVERIKQFTKILQIYYPWADKKELKSMIDIINIDDIKIEKTVWANNIESQYKQDIIELFGIFDKDNSCSIDINEFKDIFTACSQVDDKQISVLFNEADINNDGSLDIIEFIDFVSKHDELRTHFDTIINTALKKRKKSNNERLSVIFKNLPDSPQRINWRPSLSDLKSPTKIKKYLYAKSLKSTP